MRSWRSFLGAGPRPNWPFSPRRQFRQRAVTMLRGIYAPDLSEAQIFISNRLTSCQAWTSPAVGFVTRRSVTCWQFARSGPRPHAIVVIFQRLLMSPQWSRCRSLARRGSLCSSQCQKDIIMTMSSALRKGSLLHAEFPEGI